MRYVGPLAHLKGATALVVAIIDEPGRVLAQFDDRRLTLTGLPCPDVPPAEALGFGWHPFSATDFEENGK